MVKVIKRLVLLFIKVFVDTGGYFMGAEKSYTGSFARIYDNIMSSVPYNLWYKYLRELLKSYNKNPRKILDMACGTGNMSLRFAKEGKNLVGIDKSQHMLKVARQKAKKNNYSIKFLQKDIRDFNFPRQFDFIFCIFDSLNYILTIEDMEKVFVNVYTSLKEDVDINYIESDIRDININRNFDLVVSLFDSLNYILKSRNMERVFTNVYNSLEEDGVFIFDLNTINRLMSIEPGTTVFSDKNYTCFWEDIIDQKQLIWKVKLKIYFDDNESKYFKEIHRETSYKKDDIARILSDTGFSNIKVYKAFTFDEGRDNDNRLYFIVSKDDLKEEELSLLGKFKKKLKWKFLSSY